MGEGATAGQYRQRPLQVSAIQWELAHGAGQGVRARPKKHEANPDEWFVRDRFGKEHLIQPGDWVLTYPDGSNAIVAEGTFQALYEPETVGKEPATGSPARQDHAGGSQATPNRGRVGRMGQAAPGGKQGANPASEGDPD